MINNFELISNLLKFDNDDDFYHLQILKRKKENPEIKSNSYVVKTYYITSLDYFKNKQEEIIFLCDYHNARAYINLNRRSFEKIAFHMLKKTTDIIMNKDYRSVRKAYESVCGEYGSGKDKYWVIDIDSKDLLLIESIKNNIEYLEPLEFTNLDTGETKSKIISLIPTKNGYHLITTPFNKMEFNKIHSDIEIHKNNPTLLYYK